MNRIDEIKKSYDECLFKSTSMVQDVGFLLTVIDDMKAALEFYGDDKNWSDNKFIVKSDVELRDNEFNDPCGKRARQTLTKYFGSGK